MKKQRKRWIILLILLCVFALFFINIKIGNIQKFDDIIYSFVLEIRNQVLTKILITITNMGGIVSVCSIALVLTMTMFLLKKKKFGIGISLNVLFSSVVYIFLKNIFQRPRPLIEERMIEEVGYSFPSGHATNNMAFYGFIIYLVYKNIKNRAIRNIIIATLSLWIILIGFSRIYLRVHYPSDVVAGFCLGIICVILFVSVIYKKLEKI